MLCQNEKDIFSETKTKLCQPVSKNLTTQSAPDKNFKPPKHNYFESLPPQEKNALQ